MTASDPRVGEIQARLDAATPGPWRWDEKYGDEGDTGLALTNEAGAEIVGAYNTHCCSFRDDPTVEDNDAEFIAAAPADVTYLLAELRARDEVIAKVAALADTWWANFPSKARAIHAAVSAAGGGESKTTILRLNDPNAKWEEL